MTYFWFCRVNKSFAQDNFNIPKLFIFYDINVSIWIYTQNFQFTYINNRMTMINQAKIQ